MDIPKIIHYCWFGHNSLDEKALRCIESWKKFFPEYQIIQWNEENFDITSSDFMRKAYLDKKWAFVSDVARLKILYEHGGLYFDTDVEVVSSYDDILSSQSEGFIGYEKTNLINSGLGFGSVKGSTLIKSLLEIYDSIDYNSYTHELPQIACPILATNYLKELALLTPKQKQCVCGFDIYPADYFSPLDYYTGVLDTTNRTHSIHWYNASWQSDSERTKFIKKQKWYRIVGQTTVDNILGITSCINEEGLISYIITRFHKYLKK